MNQPVRDGWSAVLEFDVFEDDETDNLIDSEMEKLNFPDVIMVR